MIDNPQSRTSSVERLRLLWLHRKPILRFTAYGCLFSILLAFLIPKRFESTTKLMPPENQSSSGLAILGALAAGSGPGMGALAADLLGTKSTGAVFVAILSSRTVQNRLIERFNLKAVYGIAVLEDVRKELARNTSINEDRRTGIVVIVVSDRDPQRAANLATAYVEELDRLVAELSTSGARRERVFLEGRLNAVKQELNSAAREFSQFASKNATIDIKEQGRAMVDAAATLQGQLIAAQSELSGLEQIYSDKNVRVRSVRARIGELQRQLQKLGGKESTKEPTSDSLYPSIRNLPLLGVEYAELYRRAKIHEVVFEVLTQQYEIAKVQEVKEIPTVKVLDPSEPAEKKSFPPRLLIILVGTTVAFALAVFLVAIVSEWDAADPVGPGKRLANEVFTTLKSALPWPAQNGSRWKLRRGLFRKPKASAEPHHDGR